MKYVRCYISPAEKKKSGCAYNKWNISVVSCEGRGRRGRDRIVDGFHIITNVVSG
jgi:hypothetical protein